MIKEVCVENFTNVPLMIKRGANRIELNNDLAAGGTTPSFGVIKKTVEFAHRYNVPVIVMIRPRSGNFVYTADELEIMNNDIQMCSLLNADGIAFGCLTNNKQLDKTAMKQLIATALLLSSSSIFIKQNPLNLPVSLSFIKATDSTFPYLENNSFILFSVTP